MYEITRETIDEIIEQLNNIGPDELNSLIFNCKDSFHDAIIFYDMGSKELKVESINHNSSFLPKSNIIVVDRISETPIDEQFDWSTDLFDNEEVEEIENNYDGDYQAWLDDHPETESLEERCRNAGESYMLSNWLNYLRSIEDKLMELYNFQIDGE
ncbi:MAG TPA: hypothetical protein PK507_04355 [bacterium]|nr:hypothetical protein [bacterium]